MTDAGLASEVVDIGGASDHLPFDRVGIPVGGLFSGASELKTEAAGRLFGGTAERAGGPLLPPGLRHGWRTSTGRSWSSWRAPRRGRSGRLADDTVVIPED